MRVGKIPESVLKRSVLKYIKNNDKQTEKNVCVTSAALGEDCAFLNITDNRDVSLSTQPVVVKNLFDVERGIAGTVNNLLAAGTVPQGILLSIMMPVKTEETELKEIMKHASIIAQKNNMIIMGGHTEISEAVNEIVLVITGIGSRQNVVEKYQPSPGDDILLTKWIGIEESCILAISEEEKLRARYPEYIIKTLQEFNKYLSISTETATAVQSGSCRMHDLRSGGIFNALWELGQNAGVGLTVDLKKIPIRQETVEIGEFFERNPYEMLSTGALLLVTPKGEEMQEQIMKAGVQTTLIGKITAGNDRIVTNEEEVRYLSPLK